MIVRLTCLRLYTSRICKQSLSKSSLALGFLSLRALSLSFSLFLSLIHFFRLYHLLNMQTITRLNGFVCEKFHIKLWRIKKETVSIHYNCKRLNVIKLLASIGADVELPYAHSTPFEAKPNQDGKWRSFYEPEFIIHKRFFSPFIEYYTDCWNSSAHFHIVLNRRIGLPVSPPDVFANTVVDRYNKLVRLFLRRRKISEIYLFSDDCGW